MFMLMPGCIIMSFSIMAACPRHTNEAMHRLSGVQKPLLVAAESIICHKAMPMPPASPASAPYPASRGSAAALRRVRTAVLILLTSACGVPGAPARRRRTSSRRMLAIDAAGRRAIARAAAPIRRLAERGSDDLGAAMLPAGGPERGLWQVAQAGGSRVAS